MNLSQIFQGKTLFVIGGTGFLGKVWVSLLLHRYPEVGHIYLLVRPKEGQNSKERLNGQILPSPVFDPLRAQYPGEGFHQFMSNKITPIPGDIESENLGIPDPG